VSFHSCFVAVGMLGDQGLFQLAIANLKLLLFEVVMHLLIYFMIVLENSNSFASLNYFSFEMFCSEAGNCYFKD
jgi:hypothetical protein